MRAVELLSLKGEREKRGYNFLWITAFGCVDVDLKKAFFHAVTIHMQAPIGRKT